MNYQDPAPNPYVCMALAAGHKASGQFREAELLLRQVLAASPKFDPAYHLLGLIAFELGNLPQAIELIAKAIAVNVSVATYHRNLGELCRRQGRLLEAVQAGLRSCELDPQSFDGHYNLGLALSDSGDCHAAIDSYRRALALNPAHGLSWNNLGAALEKAGRDKDAESAYTHAIAIEPLHAEAQNNLGVLCRKKGDLNRARSSFEAAIKAKPGFLDAHYNLGFLKTYTADDPHLALLENGADRASQLSETERIRYGFALGKALEDAGQFDKAFDAYEEANRRQAGLLPFDEKVAEHFQSDLQTVFSSDLLAAGKSAMNGGQVPIFIVGMPRSGTSLLEQILASHPDVFGAGELKYLSSVVNDHDSGRAFPAFVPDMVQDDFRRLGTAYLERVGALAPGAKRITDKMPANFFYIGMIHRMLPEARIIHATRNPMDSCFSCFSLLFEEGMEFSYGLGTLGRYYQRYMQLMRHWHNVLPTGTILDVSYEDMVADTESQVRRLLDYLELPWDTRCLNFYENDRVVRTASQAQVRKPIYRSSIERWRHFEGRLDPLRTALGEFATASTATP